MEKLKASLSAENTYSDTVIIRAGTFNFSVQGVFSASVTVQRTFDNGATWYDCETFTEPGEWVGHEGEGSIYRVGIKTGGYTSGTANVRMAN